MSRALAGIIVVLGCVPAFAQEPSFAVYPRELCLEGPDDVARILAVIRDAEASTRDVSAEMTITVDPPGLATWSSKELLLLPRANGIGKVLVRLGTHATEISLQVKQIEQADRISYERDVVPILTRQGCNAGGCHGAAVGKNGFRLSLFGFDAEKDHLRLTRELRGRRLDVASPEESLLLRKPSLTVPHRGGRKLPKDHAYFDRLEQWIREGAPNDLGQHSPLTGLVVEPAEAVLLGASKSQRFLVRAIYQDGTDRDVTDLALLSSTNEGTATVDDHGVVTSKAAGETSLLARFRTQAAVSQVFVLHLGPAPEWPKIELRNEIDRHIHAKLRRLKLAPSLEADDATFFRRANLDLLGLLPSVPELRAFQNDTHPDKRQRFIQNAVERPEFADGLALEWAEALRVENQKLDPKGVHHMTRWLKDAFRTHRPMNEIAKELLTASGDTFAVPATNVFRVDTDPKALAEMTSQCFTGIRIQCAQCHNHPFERWTMDDYFGFAAFFAQVGVKNGEDSRERIVFDREGGEVRNLKNGKVAPPTPLGSLPTKIPDGTTRREALAEWLTHPENPYFARHLANRLWARFFGRGLVDPVDDVRLSNPASHPELLTWLAARLIEHHFDLSKLAIDICMSATYQRAPCTSSTQENTFASAALRRLSAEQLLDAVGEVTAVPTKYRGLPLGTRALELEGGNTPLRFLELFGRPRRQTSCACERRDEPSLGQSLHLINGATIEDKVKDRQGRLQKRIQEKATDSEIITELYLAAYARPPSEAELTERLAEITAEKDRVTALEDLYWAVLNSKEFLFNH